MLIQKVNASMFDQAYPLLQELNPNLSRNVWQSIFQPPWSQEEDYCGYGLWDGEEMVGFLGLIFSQRMINSQVERFCNITSWIVKEPYRGQSMSLMFPLMKLKDYTLTDLSAYQELFPLLKRMGFKELDSRLKLLIPMRFARDRPSGQSVQIVQTQDQIRSKLSAGDLAVFDDHQGIEGCRHMLLEVGDQTCYAVYTLNQSGRFPYCCLQYISNVQCFAEASVALRLCLAKQHQTPFIFVDSRFIAGVDLPWTIEVPLKFTKLYKSDRLAPPQIDNLYTELMLLNFNLFPESLGSLMKELINRTEAYDAI